MKRNLADKLILNRFQPKQDLLKLIEEHERKRRGKPLPSHLSGIRKGQYYRVRVPPRRSLLPPIPKLPSSTRLPLGFKPVEAPVNLTVQTTTERIQDVWSRLEAWLQENWAVIVFNFGSVLTLVGFTRSDVLELRAFSATGSLCGVAYNAVQTPLRLPPILWGMTFASVNFWKMFVIVRERNATVHLTEYEEDLYVRHFLPHGVTPKQFEAIHQKAATLHVNKGDVLVRQGERQRYIYLVAHGTTKASVLGRHITAASTTPTAHSEKKGGASGAWIGEMAFLETCWKKDVTNSNSAEKTTSPTPATKGPMLASALYTIVASEDCVALRWSHEDMEAIMLRSTDMRAAMTRAMASAVVGKVINFSVSRANKNSTWANWLGDWKNVDGASVEVLENEPVDEKTQAVESLPSYPIKKFN